jgi:uncharacterized protein YbaP (TraB family)
MTKTIISKIRIHLYIIILAGSILPYRVFSQSLLWKISGNNLPYPSYIYGTIHLTDPRVFEWKDSVYRRLYLCEAFAAEMDLSMETMIKIAGMLMLPEGETLRDRFTSEEYELISHAVKSCSGHDLSLFNKIKPPGLISLCFTERKDGDLEATVDELLYRQAKFRGITTYGIETAEEQIALFDKIPDSYVLEYFKNIDGQKVEFEKLIRCYRSANLDSLWLLIQDEESGALLNDELIRLRNYRMTERIVPLIKRQPTFVAIGTGHLPGEEGVIALLRKEGFIVEPEKIW